MGSARAIQQLAGPATPSKRDCRMLQVDPVGFDPLAFRLQGDGYVGTPIRI